MLRKVWGPHSHLKQVGRGWTSHGFTAASTETASPTAPTVGEACGPPSLQEVLLTSKHVMTYFKSLQFITSLKIHKISKNKDKFLSPVTRLTKR